MAKITLFIDENNESPTVVYDGHLTDEQVAKAAEQLGDGCYGGPEVAKQGDGEWLVTYARDTEWEREPYGISGHRVVYGQQASLAWLVRHAESRSL